MNLAVITDATGSMGRFLDANRDSFPEIAKIIALTGAIQTMKVGAYEDYCDGVRLWRQTPWSTTFSQEMTTLIQTLKAGGGGDTPEAQKTAFNELLRSVNGPTIVIHYTDAPPHHPTNDQSNNFNAEKKAHNQKNWSFDWVNIARQLAEKNVRVYTILNNQNDAVAPFYTIMAELTGGQVLYVNRTEKNVIAQVTINLFLALMGQEHNFSGLATELVYQSPFNPQKVKNEVDCGGYLPVRVHNRYDPVLYEDKCNAKIVQRVPQITPIREICINMRALVQKFDSDQDYTDFVFQTFQELFVTDKIMALTYNTVFGHLWRAICKRKEDSRREKLLGQIDVALRDLEKSGRKTEWEAVRKWLAESYNQAEDVADEVKKAPTQVPALVLEATNLYTAKEIQEIGQNCNPMILKRISELMTGLKVVHEVDKLPHDEEIPMYVPLSLPAHRIFSLLPHLMAPGAIFTKRPAVIMAMIAVITHNTILEGMATEFLTKEKGKWFDPEMPENYTFGFVKLVLRVPNFLTEDEIARFTVIRDFCGLMINGKTTIKLVRPYTANETVRADQKIVCPGCHKMRSPTLITENGQCGLCFYGSSADEPRGDDESIWYECRSCRAHYAVIRWKQMNVLPKCHYCREGKHVPTVSCTLCHNKFVIPQKKTDTFVCAQCQTDPKQSIEDAEVSLANLFAENRQIILQHLGLVLPGDMDPFVGHSLFKSKDKIQSCHRIPGAQLYYHGKPVLNSEEVFKQIYEWVISGKAEQGLCLLCFEDKSKHALISACGHRRCRTVACSECLFGWYGVPKPGNIVMPTHLACPFCKQSPITQVFKRFNGEALALLRGTGTMDPSWYYAWCNSCYKLKQAVEHVCAQGVPDIKNFKCEECQKDAHVPLEGKECPSCGVQTVKSSGCNHITCVVSECKAHWCYQCGFLGQDPNDVYTHMHKTHGGYGFNWFAGNEAVVDDEYDSDYDDGYDSY